MKTITYRPAALKALRRMPRPDSKRIMAKVPKWRFCVPMWRAHLNVRWPVVFEVVEAIGHHDLF